MPHLLKIMYGVVERFWYPLSHFYRNILIGLLIAFIFPLLHHAPFFSASISKMEDSAMDWMIKVNMLANTSGYSFSTAPKDKKYVFLNIDEDSYSKWGEPYHVPRDKLVDLIQFAVTQAAKIIVVDIDLTNPGTTPHEDEALINLLTHYDKEDPPLILIRHTKMQGRAEVLRESFIEAPADKANIYWAHPTYFKDAYDQVVRRWLLLKIACQEQVPKVVASVQLAVDMLNQSSQKELNQLDNLIASKTCTDEIGWSWGSFQYGPRLIKMTTAYGIEQRLIYTIPKPSSVGTENYPLTSIPAWLVTERDERIPISGELIDNKIVIIGTSFQDSRDHYQTPVGEMPGALIILNAIESLSKYGQMREPHLWVRWAIELSLILMMAWAFARFSSFWGTLVSGAGIVLVLLPFSFYFFKLGVWVDFAIPLLGMQVHSFIAEYEERLVMKKKLQQLKTGHKNLDH